MKPPVLRRTFSDVQRGGVQRLAQLRSQSAPRIALALGIVLLSGAVMAKECQLTAPLTLKDTQSGVVGETGTVWTIAPDCSFTVARQIGPRLLEPHKHGRLTAEQQVRLKQILARIDARNLSPAADTASHANPHRISLSYGGRHAALTMPPGAGEPGLSGAAGGDHGDALVELAATVRDMLGR